MRILIIGAGVAGLTLAALLRQRGITPVLAERSEHVAAGGYMLGLYPIGGRVLHGLGLHKLYLEASVAMASYRIGDGHGDVLRDYGLDAVTQRFGAIRGITRTALLEVIREGSRDVPVRTGTTVRELQQRGDEVDVTFDDGSRETFDLVVGADGLHSDTRRQVFGEAAASTWDTGWGGWVYWADAAAHDRDAYVEYWGPGRFLGLYPVKDGIGMFLGGPTDDLDRLGREAFVDELQLRFGDRVAGLADVRTATEDAFYWRFQDTRARRWSSGRVVLLGDAAVGFLPTAGVGASMAMESAAVLADVLGRTGADRVERALALYEKRHRSRVEAAQKSSRQLGRMMFVRSRWSAWARNQLLRFYTVEQLVKDVARIMEEPA